MRRKTMPNGRATPTRFYMLFADTDVVASQHISSHERAVDDARKIPVDDLGSDPDSIQMPGDDYNIPHMIDVMRVAVVEPVGPVALDDPEAMQYTSADGWTVVSVEPLDGLLGPQAAHLKAAVARAERTLTWNPDPPEASEVYYGILNARYETGFRRSRQCEDAAEDALTKYGADGWWWANGWFCDYGPEMLALAARDLIDEATPWNQAAYDELTAPWVAAFGPIHPEDATAELPAAEKAQVPGDAPLDA
jgi:hypothetical protein